MMMTMSTCSINPTVIEKIPAPTSTDEFKEVWGEAQVFKNGVTNERARELNFSTAKDLLPNIEVEASYSVENNDTIIPVPFHNFLDSVSYTHLTLPTILLV